ncbi:MAG: hypothetical protein ACK4NC_02410 [Candidatus Gracilibacteria bacterium]
MIIMLCSWGWMQSRGGQLSDKEYYVFNTGMICGQIGVTLEGLMTGAWGTIAVQGYFFIFTVYGMYQRSKQNKENKKEE